jgi:2-oxoisovalerate dehydrogenase E1 component alpha subunit
MTSVWGRFLRNIARTDRLQFTKTLGPDPTAMFAPSSSVSLVKDSSDHYLKVYQTMTKLRTMDKILNDAQRQGRISFYMTHLGEEGVVVGSASALEPDDIVYGQYREAGVLMWRGMTVEQMLHQCYGTALDIGKGRQMPVHYGSKELNFHTISSPLATQIPQAPGAAYVLKQEEQDNIAVCYFGEGAASEGDFHAGLGFATTMDLPVLFFCRNNGFAISTPADEQYRGDGILAKAVGHGIEGLRVDGTDTAAVVEATREARQRILDTGRPVLLETMAYRAGHHSTSDDSSQYRAQEEIDHWLEPQRDSVVTLRAQLTELGLWDDAKEKELLQESKQEVLAAIKVAENTATLEDSAVFDDVLV